MLILSTGAIVNVIANLFLIPILGIEGASLATMLGYAISDVVCVIVLYKMNLIILEKRFAYTTTFMAMYFVAWRLFIRNNFLIGTVAAVTISLIFGWLYRKELIEVFGKIRSKRI